VLLKSVCKTHLAGGQQKHYNSEHGQFRFFHQSDVSLIAHLILSKDCWPHFPAKFEATLAIPIDAAVGGDRTPRASC
jgi:hypothetical protein